MKQSGVVAMMFVLALMFGSYQPASAQKEKYHSIFIYNFTKYIKWPDNKSESDFVVGILGNSPIQKNLEAMAQSKQVNGKKIQVKHLSSVDETAGCHILYIAPEESGKIDKVLSGTDGETVLIITNSPGMVKKGAAINFVEVDGKIKFELNESNAESKGLRVAGSLVSLAIQA